MTEQQIQKKIYDYLVSKDCYVVKVVSASKSGVPDLLGCYEGRFFGIEVKTPATMANVSKLQEYNIDKIYEAGGQGLVLGSLEGLDDFLAGLLV